jgi:hypothetical protein
MTSPDEDKDEADSMEVTISDLWPSDSVFTNSILEILDLV